MKHLTIGRWLQQAAAALLGLALAGHALAFDLQAHRGGRGLWPENTMHAFEQALRLGVNTLELDTGITADGVVVVAHDASLHPAFTRDAQGRYIAAEPRPLLKNLSLAEVQAHDVGRLNPEHAYGKAFARQQPADGQRIPTLAALFELVQRLGAREVRFNIETKLNPTRPDDTVGPQVFAEKLLAVIRQHGMLGRVSIQSFDWRSLQAVQKLEPAVPLVFLSIESGGMHTLRDGAWNAGLKLADFAGSTPRLVRHAAGTAADATWSPHFNNLTPENIREAQALKLKVVPWTVNDPAVMQRLIEWGVDGLITDEPDRARQVLATQGKALAAPLR